MRVAVAARRWIGFVDTGLRPHDEVGIVRVSAFRRFGIA